MDPLLFLAHRLPYPPNKGDKVRSYHLLRHLAHDYRVLLGAFVDDPMDLPHVQTLKSWCAEVHAEPIVPWSRRLSGIEATLTGEAATLRYFRSSALQRWVEDVVRREGVKRAFVFSSAMAQYILDLPDVETIVDFVDLDSAKWADYAQRRPWPISSLYALEAKRLLAFEKLVAGRARASLFVTGEEARLLGAASPGCPNHVAVIENGVDGDYFSPARSYESPFAADEHAIVFTGTMDYWPNEDAVVWFAQEVLPLVRRRDPKARFHIVGMRPSRTVRALQEDAVNVTGRVDDVRPFLCHARVVVAPLRVARGIQNKVLEAMAMGRPSVVTSAAAAALRARPDLELMVADEASDFAAKVLDLMDPAVGERIGRAARMRVLSDYVWASRLGRIDELLARESAAYPSAQVPDGRLPAALTAASAR
jgi:sugar transferase (PEP-CTERM/EpsH1 system associated)